jgi:hypothetical protein
MLRHKIFPSSLGWTQRFEPPFPSERSYEKELGLY